MRGLLALLLALAWLGGAAFAMSPEDAYREADKRLNDEFDGLDYEAEASSPTLKAFWDAVDGLLSARGPDAIPLTVETLALDDGTLLVAVDRDQLGHLAVLDHGTVRWSSSSDPAAPGCWRGAPGRPCSTERIGLLPADAGGASRFYIQAGYAQLAGGTRGHQLSLWRWKDGKAAAFYTADFATGGDMEQQGMTLAGNELEIVGKSFWMNFSVCGGCAGRQMRHRLRLSPTGVEDLGTVSLKPELDAVDDLLGRLTEDRDTDDIATPEAAAMLKKSWHGNLFSLDPTVADHTACIAPDDNPPLTFHFPPGSMRIIAIEPGHCS